MRLVVVCLLGATLACGASSAERKAARASGYKAEFALVYAQALEVVRQSYPYLEENPTTGIIKTAWHPVNINTDVEDSPAGSRSALPGTRTAQKRYFIRFQVYVVGGDPWRIRVDGQASEWDVGGVPAELHGANQPHWLRGRIESLEVAMYRRLKQHAVPLKTTARSEPMPVTSRDVAPALDAGQLGDIPEGAKKAATAVMAAARGRDLTALAATMSEAFTWSLGAPPSARDALMMWQADSAMLDALVEVLKMGCRQSANASQVVCPPEAETSGYQGFRAAFAPGPDGTWKMVLFVSGD